MIELRPGDCLAVMAELAPDSIDAVVTDPPYDLTTGKRGGSGIASASTATPYGRARIGTGNGAGGFMGKAWDSTGIAFDPATWAAVLRVLKPGGYLLAFGGARTGHRLACAIEDAGFEIRDTIAWLYGSGFPKSMDVSKAIDRAAGATREVVGTKLGRPGMAKDGSNQRNGFDAAFGGQATGPMPSDITAPATEAAAQWAGWGTALKPAFEPIILARKPFTGTVAANVLEYGTGALNIDACRTATADTVTNHARGAESAVSKGIYGDSSAQATHQTGGQQLGRWPTNAALDDVTAAELDRQTGIRPGMKRSALRRGATTGRSIGGASAYGTADPQTAIAGYDDTGGASRFFPTFRYQAKAPRSERPTVDGISHPTVKPLALIEWLIRLVAAPGGVVLDPFAGTGTTGEAAARCGVNAVLIERETDYLPLIQARIERATNHDGRATSA